MRKILNTTIATIILGLPVVAHAQTEWQEHHRWRARDNARIENQERRINRGVQDGQLTQGQAQQLRANDRAIGAQERTDAAANNSHLTRAEQNSIRSEENANSRAIHQSRFRN